MFLPQHHHYVTPWEVVRFRAFCWASKGTLDSSRCAHFSQDWTIRRLHSGSSSKKLPSEFVQDLLTTADEAITLLWKVGSRIAHTRRIELSEVTKPKGTKKALKQRKLHSVNYVSHMILSVSLISVQSLYGVNGRMIMQCKMVNICCAILYNKKENLLFDSWDRGTMFPKNCGNFLSLYTASPSRKPKVLELTSKRTLNFMATNN